MHNNPYEDYYEEYGKYKSKIYIFIHLFFLKKIDYCICCSNSVLNAVKNELKNATYIRNGICEKKQDKSQVTRKLLNLPNDSIIFIYAGNLDSRKNVFYLINEFVKNHKNNEYLLILGDGNEYDKCLKIANDHVKMLGRVKNVNEYFSIGNIYVSASKSEGMSISILEAMNHGLGLFLSDIPSHREIFSIQNKIYIGEIFNEENFLQSLELLRNNLKMMDKSYIKEFKEHNFSAKYMISEYQKYYNQG